MHKSNSAEKIIHDMWAVDTCGILDYRLAIADFLSNTAKSKIITNEKKIYKVLGKPIKIIQNETGNEFIYLVKSSQPCNEYDLEKNVDILMELKIQLDTKKNVLYFRISAY